MTAIFLLFIGLLDLALLIVTARNWSHLNNVGRATLSGMVFLLLPIAWGGSVTLHGVHSMTTTSFCDSCHVMEPYTASLIVDDSDSIPAIHYRNNWVPQETACYDCHTQYTMFGDVKAKVTGLKHVWVNYVSGVPEEIKLYEPYANRDCLRCHGPSEKFYTSEDHKDDLEELKSGETSCLECHDTGHILPKE